MTRRSIAARLAVTIILVLSAGGALVTLAALAYGQKASDEAYDKLLAGAAFEISRAIRVHERMPYVDLPLAAFEILALAPDDRVFYRVIADDGTTLTGYGTLPAPPGKADGVQFYTGRIFDAGIRLAAVTRQMAEPGYTGAVEVVVAQTTEARTALARDIARNALALLLLFGLMLIVLAMVAVRSSLSPLRRIEAILRRRDPADLTPLDVRAPQEVETMVGAINHFMTRLSRRTEAMQNMIADSTHQLRTPIAALRAQAQLAHEEPDPDKLRQIINRIHHRTLGLSRLADQLLNRALVIHRADAAARTVLDLREIAILVSEDIDHDYPVHANLHCGAAGARLKLELPEDPVPVAGDRVSLIEATKNLVNNAFRYGRGPVLIEVRAAGDTPSPVLSVIDHGPGIPARDIAHAGERFSRPAAPRNTGIHSDSAGLGLAIVRAVAEAHGGNLHFTRRDDGTFAVSLGFPEISPETRPETEEQHS